MKTVFKKRGGLLRALCILLFALCCALIPLKISAKDGGRYEITASAANAPAIEIQSYTADFTIRKDRRIEISEQITVEFLRSGLTMFYHSLPMEGDRYYDITASCAGNDEFSFHVADNPDVDGFMDINCVGGAYKGAVWTYDISYIMEIGVDDVKNGMRLDAVGFGSAVEINNVHIRMNFPSEINAHKVFVGGYGATASNDKVDIDLAADRKTLTLSAEKLELVYNAAYGERMAEGITVEFTLGQGVLDDFTTTRIFTKDMWKILLGGLAAVALAVLFLVTNKKHELITVVNIKAPDGMDPIRMGKYLDGTVDNEDITSMIYYFAHKGYLQINLANEKDPELITYLDELPEDAPAHQKTLFDGLFAKASRTRETDTPFGAEGGKSCRRITVSALAGNFFEAAQTAKSEVPSHGEMYKKGSVLRFIFGLLLGAVFAFLTPFLISTDIGGGYGYALGAVLMIPLFAMAIIGWLKANYRYKWKVGKQRALLILEILIAVGFSVAFIALFAKHVMTEYEKAVYCLFVFLPAFITHNVLVRTEKYLDTLGQILGFKQFIVVTEEEKIKFMLEEDPQLYYKILPYAQVLGVTDEWEEKFAKLTIEPPNWYVGGDLSLVDYLIINRMVNRALIGAMVAEASKKAGSAVGRSGGGGGFGGFGGGGHGGGGFGAR